GFVSQPGHAVIGRLPRMHLITKVGGTRGLTAGRCPRGLVIPRGEEGATFANRKVGLPLSLGDVGVGVQLEGRAEGHAAVGGADVIDVTGVGAVFLRIDQANHVVDGGRLTPAHVPPVSGATVHRAQEALVAAARADEGWLGVGIAPGIAAVGGAVNLVVSVGAAAGSAAVAAVFVHACDVQVARDLVAGDLDVADEGGSDPYRSMPSSSVITGIGNAQSPTSDSKIVPGNIHSPEEGRGWIVIRKARLSVGRGLAENTEVGPASRIPGSGGLVAPQALTAAGCVQPHGKPSLAWLVVQNNRIALRTSKGSLTAGGGEAVKSGATIGVDRSGGDIDRAGFASSRVIEVQDDLLRILLVNHS